MNKHILLKQAERRAARQRLAREGIICGPRAPGTFLAGCVARALGLPLPKDRAEQSAMVRAYGAPLRAQGKLVEGRKFEFRPWVPDPRYLEVLAKAGVATFRALPAADYPALKAALVAARDKRKAT